MRNLIAYLGVPLIALYALLLFVAILVDTCAGRPVVPATPPAVTPAPPMALEPDCRCETCEYA